MVVLSRDFDNNIKYKNLPELSSTDVQRTVVERCSLLAAAWEAAAALGGIVPSNERYWRCLPREAQAIFGDVKVGQR